MNNLKLLLGEDPVERRRKEIEANRAKAKRELRSRVFATLARLYPDQDPEQIEKEHPDVIQRVMRRVGAHFEESANRQLEILSRL